MTKKHDPPTGNVSPTPAPATFTPDELAALQEKAGKADEHWDRFLRAAADLENYRKRVGREKEELARYTAERIVTALLPVLDNLDRALVAAEQHTEQPEAILQGLSQVQAQFRRALEESGLKEIIATTGHSFDPNLHEAIGHVEHAEHPEGTVIDQLQRGYKLADRLLRPARVVVSKGPAPTP
jgi:molecular chaperone GrpE